MRTGQVERTLNRLVDHFRTPVAVEIERRDAASMALVVQVAWQMHGAEQIAIAVANLDSTGGGDRARQQDLGEAVTVGISQGELPEREAAGANDRPPSLDTVMLVGMEVAEAVDHDDFRKRIVVEVRHRDVHNAG